MLEIVFYDEMYNQLSSCALFTSNEREAVRTFHNLMMCDTATLGENAYEQFRKTHAIEIFYAKLIRFEPETETVLETISSWRKA